jgi:hypothetical protein
MYQEKAFRIVITNHEYNKLEKVTSYTTGIDTANQLTYKTCTYIKCRCTVLVIILYINR